MKKVYIPILVGISIAIGIVIGVFFTKNNYKNLVENINWLPATQPSKTDAIFNLINNQYVDSIDIKNIEEDIIPEIFKHLDPHSLRTYRPKTSKRLMPI